MPERPMRSCDVCGGIDDHPRHSFDAMNSGRTFEVNQAAVDAAYEKKDLDPRFLVSIVNDLRDVTYIQRHMDCCRQVGCPTGDCDRMTEKQKSLQGYALVESITGEKVK